METAVLTDSLDAQCVQQIKQTVVTTSEWWTSALVQNLWQQLYWCNTSLYYWNVTATELSITKTEQAHNCCYCRARNRSFWKITSKMMSIHYIHTCFKAHRHRLMTKLLRTKMAIGQMPLESTVKIVEAALLT